MLDFVRNSLRLSQQTTTTAAAPTATLNPGPGETSSRRSTAVFFDPKGRDSGAPIDNGGRRTADGRVSIVRNLYSQDVEAARVRDSCAIDEEAVEVESVLQTLSQQRFNSRSGEGASGCAAADLFSNNNLNGGGCTATYSTASRKFQPNLFARGRNTEALLMLKEHLLESIISQKNNKTENANLAEEVARHRTKASAFMVQKENIEYDIKCDQEQIASLSADRSQELQKQRTVSSHSKQLQLEKSREHERLKNEVRRQGLENAKIEKILGAQYLQNNNLLLR